MSVLITKNHLKADTVRKTISDCPKKGQKGFVLRTTPNSVFTFFYQYLNKTTGKRDWLKIGEHPQWTVERARSEATRLAGLSPDKNLKHMRVLEHRANRALGKTFGTVFEEYIAYCKEPVLRRWGTVARKESWADIQYKFVRPLSWWKDKPIVDITGPDIRELYDSFLREGSPSMANHVRAALATMFKWATHEDRRYVVANPVSKLDPDEKAVEKSDVEDGRALKKQEIIDFWFGLDNPCCPGARLSRLALKLSLVTLLRTGEIVKIERELVGDDFVEIPLAVVKNRRKKKSRAVKQPLNSLARAILDEAMSIGDPNRKYVFSGGQFSGKRRDVPMKQNSLANLLTRTSDKGDHSMGICEYLDMQPGVGPHDLRRTGSCILEQLGYDDATIGLVMTHSVGTKADKESRPARVTREAYLVPVQILDRPVDRRVECLDRLDMVLRHILGLPPATELLPPKKQQLPQPAKRLSFFQAAE